MIDDNTLEKKAMALFKKGEIRKATQLQNEFLAKVKASGKDHCTCPERCRHHGKCQECVIIHRGHGDHLPFCFRDMVNKRIDNLSGLTEHSAGIGCRCPKAG